MAHKHSDSRVPGSTLCEVLEARFFLSRCQDCDCSAAEHESYRNQASFYASKWQQTDPLMIGVRRYVDEKQPEVEQLVFVELHRALSDEKSTEVVFVSRCSGPNRESYCPPTTWFRLKCTCQAPTSCHHLHRTMFCSWDQGLMPPVPGETKGLLATLRVLNRFLVMFGTWPSPGLSGPPTIWIRWW